MKAEAKTFPETSSLSPGAVVPIPTLPPFCILIASTPAGANAKWFADAALEDHVQTEPEFPKLTVETPGLSNVSRGLALELETCKADEGLVVPIPTLPVVDCTVNKSPPASP